MIRCLRCYWARDAARCSDSAARWWLFFFLLDACLMLVLMPSFAWCRYAFLPHFIIALFRQSAIDCLITRKTIWFIAWAPILRLWGHDTTPFQPRYLFFDDYFRRYLFFERDILRHALIMIAAMPDRQMMSMPLMPWLLLMPSIICRHFSDFFRCRARWVTPRWCLRCLRWCQIRLSFAWCWCWAMPLREMLLADATLMLRCLLS